MENEIYLCQGNVLKVTSTSTSTYSSTWQSSFLTCGCFRLGGLIHHKPFQRHHCQASDFCWREQDSHNNRDFIPYSSRIVCGFLNVPHGSYEHGRCCETGPKVYSPYPRRLESLTICRSNYKGSTFSSVILRSWVLIWLAPTSHVRARCSTN